MTKQAYARATEIARELADKNERVNNLEASIRGVTIDKYSTTTIKGGSYTFNVSKETALYSLNNELAITKNEICNLEKEFESL